MRHLSMALGSVCLVVATAAAQGPAPKPGPEHKRLEAFVGSWTFEGSYKPSSAGPGGKITGTERSGLLGGFWIDRRFEDKGPAGSRKGVHVFGYDPVKKTYVTFDFDNLGGYGSGTATVSGKTWIFMETRVAGGKPLQNRCPLTFAADGKSFTVKCEVSTDGYKWTPAFEGTWKKAP
jgi:hypothetical protein